MASSNWIKRLTFMAIVFSFLLIANLYYLSILVRNARASAHMSTQNARTTLVSYVKKLHGHEFALVRISNEKNFYMYLHY